MQDQCFFNQIRRFSMFTNYQSKIMQRKLLASVTLGGLSRCFLSKQRTYNAADMTALSVQIQRCYEVSFLGQGSLKTIVSKTTG